MNTLSRFTLLALPILAPVCLSGQIAVGSLSVTASQTAPEQPTGASFSVVVNAPFTASLSNVVAAVTGVGITASNLTNVGSANTSFGQTATGPLVSWTFQLSAPFSNENTVATQLAALQNTIGQNNKGFTLSFSVSTTSANPTTCNFGSLVSSARTQAQSLASAANMGVGGIEGLTNAVSSTSGTSCSLGVKFALGGYWVPGSNTITITASQTNTVTPDQALVAIGVVSGLTTGLDNITGALETAGVSNPTFTGVSTVVTYDQNGNPQSALEWSFTLTAPLATLGAELGQLNTVAQTLQSQNTGLQMGFAVEESYASQPPSCSQPALLALAQTQAQQVAAAAGHQAGILLNISANGSAVSGAGVSGFLVPIPSSTTTTTTTSTTSVSFGSTGLAASPMFCSVSAQFLLE